MSVLVLIATFLQQEKMNLKYLFQKCFRVNLQFFDTYLLKSFFKLLLNIEYLHNITQLV